MDITKIKTNLRPARQFGEYNCDSPALLLNSTMQGIRDLHQNHLRLNLHYSLEGQLTILTDCL